MKYLEKSFGIGKGNTDEYRDGWERTFGKPVGGESEPEPQDEDETTDDSEK